MVVMRWALRIKIPKLNKKNTKNKKKKKKKLSSPILVLKQKNKTHSS
jgi:hypothetical protein